MSTPGDSLHTSPHPEQRSEISLLGLTILVLRDWRLIVVFGLVCGALAFVTLLPAEMEYTAQATLKPQSTSGSRSRIAGLAQEFGVNMGGPEGGETLQFYRELLTSHEMLRALVLTDYEVPHPHEPADTVRGDLVELYQVDGATPEAQVRAAQERLQNNISVTIDVQAGLIDLSVTAFDRQLAITLNRRMLELLNAFNTETRQSQAAAEREFVGARMEEVRAELENAETQLQEFLEQNRSYETSPQLRFQAARLERRVNRYQALYTQLSQSYEQARIEEVRNTPLFTVIDSPETWVQTRRPKYIQITIIGFLFGVVLAGFVILGKWFLQSQSAASPAEYEELRRMTDRGVANFRALLPGNTGDRPNYHSGARESIGQKTGESD